MYAWVDVLRIKSEGVEKRPNRSENFPTEKEESPERHEQGRKQGATIEVTLTVTCISSLDAVENDFIFIALKDHVSCFTPVGLLL